MKITTKKIKDLDPCEDRFNNFIKHYQNYEGSLINFLNLENITYGDKVWVFTRLATHIQRISWAILCAEPVLHIFEEKYPNDNRPRKALEAAEAFALNPTEENKDAAADAADAAYAATYTAANAASAADAAYAAANAAHVAAAADAAYAATYTANAAEKQQEELNLIYMVEACRE